MSALLVTIAVAAVVFAVSEGDVLGWLSPAVVVALLLAVSATVAFASVESRHPDPLIRVNLLRLPSLRAGSMFTLLLGVERRRDAGSVNLLPAGATRLAADHRPGHGPPGSGWVPCWCVRRSAGIADRDAAVADADQRHGHARLPSADAPTCQRQLRQLRPSRQVSVDEQIQVALAVLKGELSVAEAARQHGGTGGTGSSTRARPGWTVRCPAPMVGSRRPSGGCATSASS